MSQDITQINLPGPAVITYDGQDVGHTPIEGATATVTGTFIDAKVAKYGDLPARTWIKGQALVVEFMLSQTEFEVLENLIPAATRVSDGPNSKITLGKIAGTPLVAKELKIAPILSGQSPKYDLTIPQAVPIGDPIPVYNAEAEQQWAVKFQAVVNEATGADGSFLATYGDSSISADVTPPAVSGVVPTPNDTGIDVTDPIIWTMSEDLDPATVSTGSVFLISDPTGTPVDVPGVVALVNAGASTTITFTPTSSMAAATAHTAYLAGTIKDKAGNALAPFASDFTTA